jgi:hypothetical protein
LSTKRPSRAALSKSLLNGILFYRKPPDKLHFQQSSFTTHAWLIVWSFFILPFLLASILASELSWKTGGASTRGLPSAHLSFLPICYLVLTDNVQLLMWWISFCNRICGLSLTDHHHQSMLRRIFAWFPALWKPRPP